MSKRNYNPTPEQRAAYSKKRHACLVRWVAKVLPSMGKRRSSEFFRNIAKNSSQEYADNLREEARELWLQKKHRTA
jgi:hypothetical protein